MKTLLKVTKNFNQSRLTAVYGGLGEACGAKLASLAFGEKFMRLLG